MSDKYNRYDFNFDNRGKKKRFKWLFIGLIIIILAAVKIVFIGENNINSQVNTKSFKLEIPKINSVSAIAEEKAETKEENVKKATSID